MRNDEERRDDDEAREDDEVLQDDTDDAERKSKNTGTKRREGDSHHRVVEGWRRGVENRHYFRHLNNLPRRKYRVESTVQSNNVIGVAGRRVFGTINLVKDALEVTGLYVESVHFEIGVFLRTCFC